MVNSDKRIFITGAAGFIGFHLAKALSARGDQVVGCDNFNSYYDPALKRERARLLQESGVQVHTGDLNDRVALEKLIADHETTHLVHLAAQAGVRYSITHPEEYQESNSNGFFHLLEILRQKTHIKFTFASSSSVYGLNKKIPFAESDMTDQPANFYGATKKSNELMAFSYHHLYGIATTALRFFTVYGPYGRPDMAYYFFTKAIIDGKTIKVFNHGQMQRDFTYIDDIVEGIVAAVDLEGSFEVFNLGNHKPEPLMKMIGLLEALTGKKAHLEMLPMQPGEIPITYADITKAQEKLHFTPKTSLEEGLSHFYNWYEQQFVAK